MTGAHQAQLDLVLHIFNMEGAAIGTRAHQCAHHAFGQFVDGVAHAGRRRALRAAHSQESLGQGHGNLLGRESHHIAAAADDLIAVIGGGRIGCAGRRGRRQ